MRGDWLDRHADAIVESLCLLLLVAFVVVVLWVWKG